MRLTTEGTEELKYAISREKILDMRNFATHDSKQGKKRKAPFRKPFGFIRYNCYKLFLNDNFTLSLRNCNLIVNSYFNVRFSLFVLLQLIVIVIPDKYPLTKFELVS